MVKHNLEDIFAEGGELSRLMPEYEPRPSQWKMAGFVEEAFANNKNLIVEAGTGTGKTLAYLIPAVRSGERVVISTGTKNLQEQILYKDIPFIKEKLGLKFKPLLLKGRSNYLCKKRFEEFSATGEFAKKEEINHFNKISVWRRLTKSGDIAEVSGIPEELSFWNQINARGETCLGSICAHFEECYITKLRRRAVNADLLLVNHHLLFADLSVKASGYGEVLPEYKYLILDEAHQVEKTAQNYFGARTSDYQLRDLLGDIRREMKRSKFSDRKLDNCLSDLEFNGSHLFAAFESVNDRYRIDDMKKDPDIRKRYDLLHDTIADMSLYLESAKKVAEDFEPLERRADELGENLKNIIEYSGKDYVFWAEIRRRAVFLYATPLKIKKYLKTFLFDNLHSTVLTSATLTVNGDFKYIQSRTGFQPERKATLPSEFDFQSRALLYIPTDLPLPSDNSFYEKMSARALEILELTEGNAFLLFTSLRGMREVHDILSKESGYNIFMQGEMPKMELIEKFRSSAKSLLLASMSFWQGVDIQGDDLRCVIIDKLPFAVPSDPVISAEIDYLNNSGGDPFNEFQVPSAVMLLKQGLGRLIRHREDYGIAAVMDRRMIQKGYGKSFLRSLPPFRLTTDMEQLEENFAAIEKEI